MNSVSDEKLAAIRRALPPDMPADRIVLLCELVRAWLAEELPEHLLRATRAEMRLRRKMIGTFKQRAKELLYAAGAMDDAARFEVALLPQMHRDGTDILTTDAENAVNRRDAALAWLKELSDVPDRQDAGTPDKKTRSYLIVRDLAAIYEAATGQKVTRRTTTDTHKQYGPFWDFVSAVSAGLPIGDLDHAIRDVQKYRNRESSPFMANLQFRHPKLWQKLNAETS